MKKISFNIDEDLFKNFKKYCIDQEMTMTNFLISMIKDAVKLDSLSKILKK